VMLFFCLFVFEVECSMKPEKRYVRGNTRQSGFPTGCAYVAELGHATGIPVHGVHRQTVPTGCTDRTPPFPAGLAGPTYVTFSILGRT
jgi:hypothetical protein